MLKKKIASLLIMVLILSLSAVPAAAAYIPENDAPPLQIIVVGSDTDQEPEAETGFVGIAPAWANILSINPSISVSGGTASYTVIVSAYSNTTSLKVTATIQKLSSGTYNDVTSSSKTFSGKSAVMTGSSYVGSGTFRLKVTVVAYGSTTETVTVYS